MVPELPLIDRFTRDLDALAPGPARLGIAVSGGSDSLALLLLAAAARPGLIEAATVDHHLRDGSRAEALAVGALCGRLGVPHTVLTAEWPDQPNTAIQERARIERYRLLADWARAGRFAAVLTGHHADDQAETMLMRLNRGAGVKGLRGMRPRSRLPGSRLQLLRPLLAWRRSELERVCAAAGVKPMEDPSNSDQRFERARIRNGLAVADWLDPAALASSAAHLAAANEAIDWAVDQEWSRAVSERSGKICYVPEDAPTEIIRRIVARAITNLAHEGADEPLRARELEPLLSTLRDGGQTTLRGVLCIGGPEWRFAAAPPRNY
jgi:tRNA(Ile)-lysidine synthase